MSLRHGSTCSGIGGPDLAFEQFGIETVYQCEIEKFPNKVLGRHWPNVARFPDLRDPAFHDRVRRNDLRADIISGGTPCQDLSIAGKRAGLAGVRSGLFFDFAALIERAKPDYVLWENVPGAFSSNDGQDFQVVKDSLRKLGYGLAWRVLDAQYAGVPQRRRRIFLVGHLGGRGAAEVLFGTGVSQGDLVPFQQAWSEASRNSRGRSKVSGSEDAVVMRMREGKAGGGKGPLLRADQSLTIATGNDQVVFYRKSRRAQSATDPETWVEDKVANTLNVFDSGESRATGLIVYAPAVAGTLTSRDYKGPRFDHAEPNVIAYEEENEYTVRRLTPIEYERLQGFPDKWTCTCKSGPDSCDYNCPDGPRYKAIGNSVAVPVLKWIGERIKMHSEGKSLPPALTASQERDE